MASAHGGWIGTSVVHLSSLRRRRLRRRSQQLRCCKNGPSAHSISGHGPRSKSVLRTGHRMGLRPIRPAEIVRDSNSVLRTSPKSNGPSAHSIGGHWTAIQCGASHRTELVGSDFRRHFCICINSDIQSSWLGRQTIMTTPKKKQALNQWMDSSLSYT